MYIRLLVTSPLVAAGLCAPNASAAVTPGNGLALTPPMGFNNWNSTHCRADFNETMVKGIADIFVTQGLKDAGYQYVNLDDCWALPQRGPDGNLVPDPVRFPNGITHVADYVHAKGLKFGIYTSAGSKTCNSAGFINGVQYAKGLGTHAPGVVEYYVAGRCTGFTADVGLDDEKGNNGTATFEVWADGRKVADSGALTNLMPAKPLSADITGATLVRLISTDAGDGNNSDHTDWADARLTCSQ